MKEIKLFYDWLETYPLSPASIALWHALMFIANRSGWKVSLRIPYSLLELRTGMSRTTLFREREKLRKAGRITFRSYGGRACCVYRLIPLEGGAVFPLETQAALRPGFMVQPETQTLVENHFVSPVVFQNETQYKLNRVINSEKEKTSKKEKGGSAGEERKSCAKKREMPRLNQAQFLSTLDPAWREPMTVWLEYKRIRRESYRSESGARKCLSLLRDFSGEDPSVAASIIDRSIANNWAGLFPLPAIQSASVRGQHHGQPTSSRVQTGLSGLPRREGGSPRMGQIIQPANDERARNLLEKFDRK